MKKKEEKSRFRKISNAVVNLFVKAKWIFLCLFISIVFAINVAILLFVENLANLLTFYSGWLSVIATSIIGIIALWQGRKYKKENDIILKRQIMANNVEKEIVILEGIRNELESYFSASILFNIFTRNYVLMRSKKGNFISISEEINDKISSLLAVKSRFNKMVFSLNDKIKTNTLFDSYLKIVSEKREIVFHCAQEGTNNLSSADLAKAFDLLIKGLTTYVSNIKKLHANILDYSIGYEQVVEEYNKSICIVQNGWKA